jgi:DNA-binding NarL/FixJ family response regulator
MAERGASAWRVVLVVDDRPYVCRALARVLKYRFQHVHTATTFDEAEALLGERRVTHVVCDCALGEDQPRTFDRVPDWRRCWPSIERVVLFSGTDLTDVSIPPEVDAVVPKGADPRELIESLEP